MVFPFPTEFDSFCDINEKLTNCDVQKGDKLLLFKLILFHFIQKSSDLSQDQDHPNSLRRLPDVTFSGRQVHKYNTPLINANVGWQKKCMKYMLLQPSKNANYETQS